MASDPQSFERYSRFLQTLSRSLTVLGATNCNENERHYIECAVRDNDLNCVQNIVLDEDLSKDGAALEIAANNGQQNIVNWLLKNRRLLESSGRAALNKAIYKGHSDIAIDLIKAGFSYGRNTYGETLLFVAASAGNARMTEYLVHLGCNLHALTRMWTPLHVAAYRNHHNVLAILLKYGSDPTIKNKDGNNALHLALSQGHTSCVQSILHVGCDFSMQELESRLAVYSWIRKNPLIRRALMEAQCEPRSLLNLSRIKLRSCMKQQLLWKVDMLHIHNRAIPKPIRNFIMMEDVFLSSRIPNMIPRCYVHH